MRNWLTKYKKMHLGKETRKSLSDTFKKLAWRGSVFFSLFGAWFGEEKGWLILLVAAWWIAWQLLGHAFIAYKDTS